MCRICDALGQRVEAGGSIVAIGPMGSEAEIQEAFLLAMAEGEEGVTWGAFDDE